MSDDDCVTDRGATFCIRQRVTRKLRGFKHVGTIMAIEPGKTNTGAKRMAARVCWDGDEPGDLAYGYLFEELKPSAKAPKAAPVCRRPASLGGAKKRKPKERPSYDTSTSEGQKRLMQESAGFEYVAPQRIATTAPGDYGADPIGPGDDGVFRWRMVPSGDIVDKAEHDRRLKRGLRGRLGSTERRGKRR